MATADQTYVYRQGTSANTHAVVSQKNKVYSYQVGKKQFQQVGVMSTFGLDESRTVDPIRGIGFGDQVAELVPANTEPVQINVEKTLLYILNAMQAMGYKGGIDGLVRSLKHHRWPFDIKQEMVFSELASFEAQAAPGLNNSGFKKAQTQPSGPGFMVNEVKALFTFFEACWFESYGTSFGADQGMVAESCTIKASDVIDGISNYGEYIDTGLAPVGDTGGGPGLGFSIRFSGGPNPSTANILAT